LKGVLVCVWREFWYKFGESFGTSLEKDWHQVEVTPNLELLVTFGMSLEEVCHEL
jgi:hypothetical protein